MTVHIFLFAQHKFLTIANDRCVLIHKQNVIKIDKMFYNKFQKHVRHSSNRSTHKERSISSAKVTGSLLFGGANGEGRDLPFLGGDVGFQGGEVKGVVAASNRVGMT